VKLYSLALDIAPLTGKIIENRVFERAENLLWISQLSEIELQS